jgi:hypothetical protein
MVSQLAAVKQAKTNLEIEVFAANQIIEKRDMELLEKQQTLDQMSALIESL